MDTKDLPWVKMRCSCGQRHHHDCLAGSQECVPSMRNSSCVKTEEASANSGCECY